MGARTGKDGPVRPSSHDASRQITTNHNQAQSSTIDYNAKREEKQQEKLTSCTLRLASRTRVIEGINVSDIKQGGKDRRPGCYTRQAGHCRQVTGWTHQELSRQPLGGNSANLLHRGVLGCVRAFPYRGGCKRLTHPSSRAATHDGQPALHLVTQAPNHHR